MIRLFDELILNNIVKVRKLMFNAYRIPCECNYLLMIVLEFTLLDHNNNNARAKIGIFADVQLITTTESVVLL